MDRCVCDRSDEQRVGDVVQVLRDAVLAHHVHSAPAPQTALLHHQPHPALLSLLHPHRRHLPPAARLLRTNWSRSVHHRAYIDHPAAFARIVTYFRFCG